MGGEFWYVGNDELPLGVVFKSTAIVKESIVIMHCSTHSHRHAGIYTHACICTHLSLAALKTSVRLVK